MSKLINLKKELNGLANKKQAKIFQRFFKTGPGEYGEGDKFLGIKVPMQRMVANKYLDLSLADLQILLNNKFHEYRLTALIILLAQYRQADLKTKEKYYRFYLKNYNNINNWDLVDLSASGIVGDYLNSQKNNNSRIILYKFAKSDNLWKRRIAIVATYDFIRNNDYKDIIKLAGMLLNDKHDLIHKATGWMLREIGKRDKKILINFLDKHTLKMPRTMLRYAIERFDEKTRKYYLNKR